MDEFISKPVTTSELLKALARFAPARKHEEGLFRSQSKSAAKARTENFDPSALLARLEGDAEAFQELSQLFLESVTLQIKALRSALEYQDLTQIARSCHTIKGLAPISEQT